MSNWQPLPDLPKYPSAKIYNMLNAPASLTRNIPKMWSTASASQNRRSVMLGQIKRMFTGPAKTALPRRGPSFSNEYLTRNPFGGGSSSFSGSYRGLKL